MVEVFDENKEGLFEEVVDQGREEGVADKEAYDELVETVIEDHRRLGEIHDDSSYDALVETLQARWPDYREAIGLDEAQPEL